MVMLIFNCQYIFKLRKLNASALTGDLTTDLSNIENLKVLESGSGDDDVIISADKTVTDMILMGGKGDDTLTLTTSGDKTISYDMSGFETLKLEILVVNLKL